jgi:hypothetical protein
VSDSSADAAVVVARVAAAVGAALRCNGLTLVYLQIAVAVVVVLRYVQTDSVRYVSSEHDSLTLLRLS